MVGQARQISQIDWEMWSFVAVEVNWAGHQDRRTQGVAAGHLRSILQVAEANGNIEAALF